MAESNQLELSGNIFVDQGQMSLKCLMNKPYTEHIELEDLKKIKSTKEIYGSEWLSQNLDLFKSFTMIFGSNHPLYQYAFKKLNVNRIIFKEIIIGLVDETLKIYTDNKGKNLCEICGNQNNFNFDEFYRKILKENYPNYNPEPKFSCREFFPLAGTMGSESQTFSNMSIAPRICPRCLLMVYYLPFSSQIIEGNLAIIQSSDFRIQFEMVKNLVEHYRTIIQSSSNKKIENIGKKEKNKNLLLFKSLLEYFDNLLPEIPSHEDILNNFPKQNLDTWLWKYTNSGQGAYLEVEEIPNNAISFIYLTYCLELNEELYSILKKEVKWIKNPKKQLYSCIKNQNLYQFNKLEKGDYKINPIIIFLYLHYILGYSLIELNNIIKITEKILEENNPERIIKEYRKRSIILSHKAILKLIDENEIKLENYLHLFPLIPKSPKYYIILNIISLFLNIEIQNEEFSTFIEYVQDYLDYDIKTDPIKSITPLVKEEEELIYQTASIFFNYFRKKYDHQKLADFINEGLKYKSKSWFSEVFARIMLEFKDCDLNYYHFYYLNEIIGGWNNFKRLMQILFRFWYGIKKNEEEDLEIIDFEIPKRFIFSIKNIEGLNLIKDYLSLRSSKGMNYLKQNLIEPIIKKKITVDHFLNFLHNHRDELLLKDNFRDKFLLNPKTGKEDKGYANIFLKLIITEQFINLIKKKN